MSKVGKTNLVHMHIFAERYLFDSSDALAKNTQNFSRNVVTEQRREISRRVRETFALFERNPNIKNTRYRTHNIEVAKYGTKNIEAAKSRKQNIEHKITKRLNIKSYN